MTRILLLGTTGQVGWELHRALQPLGEVVALARAEADFSKPNSLEKLFTRRYDVVVNAVAYTAVDQAETDSESAFRINAEAIGVLADQAKKHDTLLIHYSTDYVFEGSGTSPYTEVDPTGPQSVYGRSKLAGEAAIIASGCDHLILRTSWVFASRGKNFLRTILRLACERKELRIVGDQYGAPTSARLIADVTSHVLAHAIHQRRTTGAFDSEVLHLVASGRTSWHGFATAIVDEARRLSWPGLVVQRIDAITTAEFPVPAKRPANSLLSTERIVQRFGTHLPDWSVGVRVVLDELRTW